MSNIGTYAMPVIIIILAVIVFFGVYSNRNNKHLRFSRSYHQKASPAVSRQEWPRMESSWTTLRPTDGSNRPGGAVPDLERGNGDVLPKYSRSTNDRTVTGGVAAGPAGMERPPPAYQP